MVTFKVTVIRVIVSRVRFRVSRVRARLGLVDFQNGTPLD